MKKIGLIILLFVCILFILACSSCINIDMAYAQDQTNIDMINALCNE